MTQYRSDEEKVEDVKRWWMENGKAVIVGIVLGLGGLFGWKYWSDQRETAAEQASDIYMAATLAAQQGNTELLRRHTETLQTDYTRTPYAALSAMELARLEADRGDLERAEALLRWTRDQARQDEVTWLATVRLARVLVATDRPEEALALVQGTPPAGFEALVEELRGDALRQQGDHARALEAYDRALGADAGGSDYLRMKRDEVAALASGADA